MSASLPSDSIQEATINDNLNNLLLTNLLLGIYTVVYFTTLYMYANKKPSKNWLVIGCISGSYVTFTLSTGVQWYLAKQAFVNDGTSRESVFIAIFSSPVWDVFLNDICIFIAAALADVLMIWRCYNAWDRSWRVIAVPIFLLICEIALDFSVIGTFSSTHGNPSPTQAKILNTLSSVSILMTFLTTLATTLLITYRIQSISSRDVLQGSRARFNHVFDILVQSAAAYTVVALAYAVVGFIPFTADNFILRNALNEYLAPFYGFIAGVAPTIMVARVALATYTNSDVSVITHISGIQFQSAVPDVTQLESQSIHAARELIPERKNDAPNALYIV